MIIRALTVSVHDQQSKGEADDKPMEKDEDSLEIRLVMLAGITHSIHRFQHLSV